MEKPVDWLVTAALAFGVALVLSRVMRAVRAQREQSALRREGVPARAVVKELRDTLGTAGSASKLALALGVHGEEESWEVTIHEHVRPADISRVQPGGELAVRYDAQNRDRVVLDDALASG